MNTVTKNGMLIVLFISIILSAYAAPKHPEELKVSGILKVITQDQLLENKTGDWNLWKFRGYNEGIIYCGSNAEQTQEQALSFTFTGTKAYITGEINNTHNALKMFIDGEYVSTISLYDLHLSGTFPALGLLGETPELPYGEHTVKLQVSNQKNASGWWGATIDDVYYLDNTWNGLLELSVAQKIITEHDKMIAKIKWIGNKKNTSTAVKIASNPESIIDSQIITFNIGETEKEIEIQTNTQIGNTHEIPFTLELSNPEEGTQIGLNGSESMLLTRFPNWEKDKVVDLFIWAGQSNAQGWQGDGAKYPADTDNLDTGIGLNYTFINNTGSEGSWIPMQAQKGRFEKGHFGPEVSFSRELKKRGYNPAVFKYTLGGSSIYNDWKRAGEGGFYDRMVKDLKLAIQAIEAKGWQVKIRGFVWIQGESDAENATMASLYYSSLLSIIKDLRTNVFYDESVPVLLGVDEQHGWVVQHPVIVEAQKQIAAEETNVRHTSMVGFEKADNTHLTPEALVEHGKYLFTEYQMFDPTPCVLDKIELSPLSFKFAVGENINNIRSLVDLPIRGKNGSSISWKIIGEDKGNSIVNENLLHIKRPGFSEKDEILVIEAKISMENIPTEYKQFTGTVKAFSSLPSHPEELKKNRILKVITHAELKAKSKGNWYDGYQGYNPVNGMGSLYTYSTSPFAEEHSVSYSFIGTKAFVTGYRNATMNKIEVTIDGVVQPKKIDLYQSEADGNVSKLIYETPTLPYGEHTVKLKITDESNIAGYCALHIDDVYYLDNDGKPLVSLSMGKNNVYEGENIEIVLDVTEASTHRNKDITVQLNTTDNTAWDKREYLKPDGLVVFAPGETQKKIIIRTLLNKTRTENGNFCIQLSTSDEHVSPGLVTENEGKINDGNWHVSDNVILSGDWDGPGLSDLFTYNPKITTIDMRNASKSGNEPYVIPSASNCLVYATENMGLSKNIIVDGVCSNLQLTDGLPFDIVDEFHALEAEFTRPAISQNKWSSIALPFDIPAGNLPEKYIFEKFDFLSNNTLHFKKQEEYKANEPHLIQWTGDENEQNLCIKVSGADIKKNNSSEIFQANYTERKDNNIYILNDTGDGFIPANTESVLPPFRGYLPSGQNDYSIQHDQSTSQSCRSKYTDRLSIELNGSYISLFSTDSQVVYIRDIQGRVLNIIPLTENTPYRIERNENIHFVNQYRIPQLK